MNQNWREIQDSNLEIIWKKNLPLTLLNSINFSNFSNTVFY